jgi:hypothetical protein
MPDLSGHCKPIWIKDCDWMLEPVEIDGVACMCPTERLADVRRDVLDSVVGFPLADVRHTMGRS